jgi:hypothetical protein
MKISEVLLATPLVLLFVIAHVVYIYLCLITAAWVHSIVDEIRDKIYPDPLCGMGPFFCFLWVISTIVFCFYWGNHLQEWGY